MFLYFPTLGGFILSSGAPHLLRASSTHGTGVRIRPRASSSRTCHLRAARCEEKAGQQWRAACDLWPALASNGSSIGSPPLPSSGPEVNDDDATALLEKLEHIERAFPSLRQIHARCDSEPDWSAPRFCGAPSCGAPLCLALCV